MQRVVNKKPPSMKAISQRLKQEQDIKQQRNKLAMSSIKDTISLLSPMGGSNDEEEFDLTDFDVNLYYSNPKVFQKLPFYKRSVVEEDNKERMRKNWRTLSKDSKRFSFWWAYGAHGPRDGFPEQYDWFTPYEPKSKTIEKVADETKTKVKDERPMKPDNDFDNLINSITPKSTTVQHAARAALQTEESNLNASQLNTQSHVPLDLPFKYPSILNSAPFSSKVGIKAHRLPALDPRSFGVKRIQQYREDRRMNPVAKIALVICIFLTVLCFKQDRRVNNTGVVPEYPWVIAEREEKERLERIKEAEEQEKQLQKKVRKVSEKPSRKWYFLWLR